MKRFLLLLSDIAALYGTLVLVLFIRYSATDLSAQLSIHIVPFSFLFAIWLLSLYIGNLYDSRILRNDRFFYERLVQAIGVATILSLGFFYLVPYFGITPKTNLFLFIVIFALLEIGVRYLYNRIIAGGTKKGVLIVGITPESLRLAQFIDANPQLGYSVAALVRVGHDSALDQQTVPWTVREDLSDIQNYVREARIDMVVMSPAAYTADEVVSIFYRTISEAIDFTDLATFTEQLTGTVPLGAINQTWFLENIRGGSQKPYEVFKRVMDLGVGFVLGATTLVLVPFIAAAIKLDSPGPIFFRQRRTGRAGTTFDIIKFRSMRMNAEKESGAVWATENDPRVTRIGKILRKTRIDELPQLWNVLRGQMSLVGPRAERPEFDQNLATEVPFYMERYLIKPGISGWAQINYPYGASTHDAMQKLTYDLYYIKHRSLVLDLEIILKTISISLRRAGR